MTDQRFMLLSFDIVMGSALLIAWGRDLYDRWWYRRELKRQLEAQPIVYPAAWLLDIYGRGGS